MSSRSTIFAIAVCLNCLLSLRVPAVAETSSIRSMNQVVKAFKSKPRKTRQFDLEARVTLRIDGWTTFRLQANGHSIHAEIEDGSEAQLAATDVGDRVRVRGKISRNRNALFVDSIKVVEEGTPNSLRRMSTFADGKPQFWKYVCQAGTITEVLRRTKETRIKLKTPSNEIWFSYYSNDSITDASLVGMRASVAGVLLADKIAGQEPRPRIVASRSEQFRVWEVPKEIADETATVELSPDRGFISHVDDHSFIACGWRIRSSMCTPLAVNLPVSVELADLDHVSRTARAVQTRVLSGPRHAKVPPTSVNEISPDNSMYRVVCVEGEIVKCVVWPTQVALSLSQSGKRFTAYIPRDAPQSLDEVYESGQRARVVGAVHFREGAPGQDFALHVSTLDDIQLIRSAFVLQRNQIALAAAGLLFVAALAAGWHVALRRRVAAKTKELSQLNAVMVAAAAAVQNGIVIFDEEDNVLRTNENLHQMFGTAEQGDSAAQVFHDVIAPRVEDRAALLEFFSSFKTLARGVGTQEFATVDPNGWIVVNTATVVGEGDQPIGRIWTFEDVSERKRLEQETTHSRKLQAVGRLAGGIAHDFNNLLQVIGANMQTLRVKRASGQEWDGDSVENAVSAVERGAVLTRQLLAFSSRTLMQPKPVQVNRIVRQVHALLRCSLDANIDVPLDLDESAWLVEADEGQLEQVIINLCINSRDAIGGRRGKIRISTSCRHDRVLGDCVVVSVEDDGCGMPEEVLPHIFEPFFTTKASSEGTGLGLSMAHGIIQQHDGTMKCRSTVGRGTVFEICLPRSESNEEVAEESMETQEVSSAGLRILLVDDDWMVRQSGQALMEAMGHTVEAAVDGVDALEKLNAYPDFDIVILDMTMPRMSGVETLEQIRKRQPALKVVLCSGYSEDAHRAVQTTCQADGFLAKPFSLGDLTSVMQIATT